MSRHTGYLCLTGFLPRDMARHFAETIFRLGLRPYRPEQAEQYPTFNIETMRSSIEAGADTFWITRSSSVNFDKNRLLALLGKTALSWCFLPPNRITARVKFHDATTDETHHFPWMNGEIALTASQAEDTETRESILRLRSQLVSRGMAVVGSHHEMISAIADKRVPEDHIVPALALAKMEG